MCPGCNQWRCNQCTQWRWGLFAKHLVLQDHHAAHCTQWRPVITKRFLWTTTSSSLAPPAAQILQMESTFVISCLSAVNGILKYNQWNPRTFILWWSVFSWCRRRCEFNRVHLRRLFANIAIDQYPGIPIIKDFGHDDDDQNQLRCGWWRLRIKLWGGFALAD